MLALPRTVATTAPGLFIPMFRGVLHVDISKMLERIRKLLFSPKAEWPVIAAESATLKDIYVPYVVIMAAVPAVAGFIKGSLIGYSAFGMSIRLPIGAGLANMLAGYALALVLVFVMALIINALAGTFGGQKNQAQALKTAAWAWCAVWLAGIGVLIPLLGVLLTLAGIGWTIYLLYTGLPHTMQCPPEKAGAYTATTIVIAIIASLVLAWIVGSATGITALKSGAISGAATERGSAKVTFDKDSRLGKIAAMAERMEEAGKQLEQRGKEMEASGREMERSGREAGRDAQAGAEALGAMMGALAGREDGKPAESMPADALRAFLPETIGKLERRSLSAKRESAMGVYSTTASASYADDAGEHDVKITITDTPMMAGTMALANMFTQESESENDGRYEKTWSEDGQRYEAKWDKRNGRGSWKMSYADRFQIEVTGKAEGLDELRKLATGLDLKGIARAAAESD